MWDPGPNYCLSLSFSAVITNYDNFYMRRKASFASTVYATANLFIRLSVRPSDRCVYCDETK